MKYKQDLIKILNSNPKFMMYLETAHRLGLKNYCVGAGSIRDTVWSYLHNINTVKYKDIDLAYFNKQEDRIKEEEYEQQLNKLGLNVEWDVKNQALVHEWYEQKFGIKVKPYTSIEDAISTWPEPATSVAVYLNPNNQMQVIAPLGLDDLFNITLRRNKKRISQKIFEERLKSKDMVKKWPNLTVIRS
ncbi:nucleotidyltransferase family protein [Clostridium sp. 'deep sea']|uniref:nucleotidyltransferase family protein n=1 Tax=Clostridium sp. 'deep sea' TaxID=2779445 RepID=UPI00189650AF|nr:nucleotidyltransferase family protein [Clostridium sp. 'deep sea']QOR34724.1 nucleotidyltransferase family protein [Clostridium sp. 'deep sea']